MKEWICREISTATSGNENGVLMMETELIRCKECKFYSKGICWFDDDCYVWSDNDFCSRAERKEE